MSDPASVPPATPALAEPSIAAPRLDPRSDIEQIVEARKDAVERGEGGAEPETFTSPGAPDGVGGTGGVTKNQEDDAQ